MGDEDKPTPKITSETKEKNPGRVAAGKRLAAMNRTRLVKTVNHHDATEPTQREVDDCDDTNWSSPMVILSVVGVATGVACLYYTYKQDKRSDRAKLSGPEVHRVHRSSEPTNEVNPAPQPTPAPSGGSNLKSFD